MVRLNASGCFFDAMFTEVISAYLLSYTGIFLLLILPHNISKNL